MKENRSSVIARAFVAIAVTVLVILLPAKQALADDIASGTWGTCPWEISEDGVLTVHPGVGASQSGEEFSPWDNYSDVITSIVFAEEGGRKVVAPKDLSGLLCGLSNAVSIDASGLNTSSVTSLNNMFSYCYSLSALNTSGWDTSSVTDMSLMFMSCGLSSLDVSGWNTSSVTNMTSMFESCSALTSLDVSRWDTSNVTSMYYMFSECASLTSLNLSSWDVSSVTDMSGMFKECSNLSNLNLSGWNTSNVTRMGVMFSGCTSLTSLDLSKWDTSSVRDMRCMFYWCTNLSSLNVSRWNTSRVSDMYGLFSGCSSLSSLDISRWDVSVAYYMTNMFSDCSSLVSIDVSSWDVSNVYYMGGMFSKCTSLKSLDVSNWNTSLVRDLSFMFRGCTSLSSLNVSKWDTSSVTDMAYMFCNCRALASLDVSNWDTSSVENMWAMFANCSALTSLDVSGWNVSSVTNMESLFDGCSSLTSLNLTKWNTSSVTTMTEMFNACSKLKTIVAGSRWSVSAVANSSNMFNGCTSLVGGNGTAYDANHLDAEYARVDADSTPGYFTASGQEISIAAATIEAIPDQTWTGSALRPSVTVSLNGKTLVEGTDFTVSYSNNVEVGTATVTITGKGAYTGTKTATFWIIDVDPNILRSRLRFDFANTISYFGYNDPTEPEYYARGTFFLMWGRAEGTVVYGIYRAAGVKRAGGNCFGMSYAAALMAVPGSGLVPSDFDPSATAPSTLGLWDEHAETSMTLRDYIEALHVSQWMFWGGHDLEDLCAEVQAGRRSGRPVLVNLRGRPAGNHTVLAFAVETASETERWIHVYDPNSLPNNGGDLHIVITRDARGGWTRWHYKSVTLEWDSEDSGAELEYVPFSDLQRVWDNRGTGVVNKLVYIVAVGSSSFRLTGAGGDMLAVVQDGVLIDAAEGVQQRFNYCEDDGEPDGRLVTLYVPRGLEYVVTDLDGSSDQLVAGVVCDGQASSVVTDASEVAFAVDETGAANLVEVSVADGDAYTITVASDLESAAGLELIELSGVGTGDSVSAGTIDGSLVVDAEQDDVLMVNGEEVDICSRIDISGGEASLEYASCTYDGTPCQPRMTVMLGGVELVEGTDFAVRYSSNIEVGTATATAYGIGGYYGAVRVTFEIAEPPAGPFFLDADPADDANHGAEVDWMGRSGISAGWEVSGGREYRGLETVKRCDFAAFLYRMADISDDGARNDSIALTPSEVESVLSDVRDCSASTDHAAEIAWLISTGISRGWQNGDGTVSFKPYANVARQDMAAFLYRFADLDDDGVQNGSPELGPQKVAFSDVVHGDDANHAAEVEWLASVGVTKGWDMGNGTYQFRGTRNVARQDMAAFMYRLYTYLQSQG